MADSRLRKDPQQARSRRTVDAILEAADRVLKTDGYEAASTNRLARVAGFSVGSLYQYFDDKESVVGELIDRLQVAESEALAERVEELAGRPLAELLGATADFMVQGRYTKTHLFRTLEQHPSDLSIDDAVSYAMQRIVAAPAIHRTLAPSLARVRPGGPLDEMVFVIASVVNAASFAFAADAPPAVSVAALVEQLTAVLCTYAGSATAVPRGGHEPLCGLLARWMPDAEDAPSVRPARATRLQEARSTLLRAPDPPEPLEAAVYVLAAVADVAFDARNGREGLDGKVIAGELARMAGACVSPLG